MSTYVLCFEKVANSSVFASFCYHDEVTSVARGVYDDTEDVASSSVSPSVFVLMR